MPKTNDFKKWCTASAFILWNIDLYKVMQYSSQNEYTTYMDEWILSKYHMSMCDTETTDGQMTFI